MTKTQAGFVVILLALLSGVALWTKPEVERPLPVITLESPVETKPWSVHFSPHGGVTDALVNEIGRARKSVHVQIYSFTSPAICDALNAASIRARVVVIVDERWNRGSKDMMTDSLAGSVEVYSDSCHPIAHNKIAIIDGKTVCTGSFNFTRAGEENAENLVILHDKELAEVYEANFQKHLSHSKLWESK